MNRSSAKVLVAFCLLIGAAGFFLIRAQANYKLGDPGVRLGKQPLFNEKNNRISDTSVLLPSLAGYNSSNLPVTQIELNMLPPDTQYGRRIYKAPDGFEAMISVVLMGTDRTSIHKPQYCLLGQGWTIDKSEVDTVPIGGPRPYDLKVMKLTTSTRTRNADGREVEARGLFVYWFVADNQLTPSHGQRMWWMARDLLTTGTLQRWAYVAYFATCWPGQEKILFERLKSLISQTVPEFQVTTGRATAHTDVWEKPEMIALNQP